MNIYVDLSISYNKIPNDGISRMSQEVVNALKRCDGIKIMILTEATRKGEYFIDNRERAVSIDEMDCDVFLDIDACWMANTDRWWLYRQLKAKGIKIATYVYDIIPIKYPHFFNKYLVIKYTKFFGAAIHYADVVLSETGSVLCDIESLCHDVGIQKPILKKTWCGCDFNMSKGDNIDKRAIAMARKPYLLEVGTIEPRKGHKVMLDAIEKGMGMRTIIAGKYGWNSQEVVDRIKKLPSEKVVHLEDLNSESIDFLYRNAFALVFPTMDEGFGLPVVEALKRGTPVFTSNIPVMREIGGTFCEYFEQNNSDEIVNLVNSYANDIKKYHDMKQRIKNYQTVSWREVGERIKDYLVELNSKT